MTCINLVEITWKKMILNYCSSNTNSRMLFDTILSCLHLGIGFATIVMSRVCIYSLTCFGWLFTAMISPLLLGGTGLLFFVFMYLKISFVFRGFIISSLLLAVIIGMLQNISSKTCKYTFFDSTKEIGFLYLPKNKRDQSKSAIDMLGGRFGKSIGSVFQQSLLAFFVVPSQLKYGQEIIGKYICIILLVFIVIWIFALFILNNNIKEQQNVQSDDESTEKEQQNVQSDDKSTEK